jgi:Phage portal protein
MGTSLIKTIADAFSPVFRPAGNLIEGVNPGSWASPQNPIRPTLQLGTGIRQWDFTPGINLQFTPRGDVAIKFPQLWNVSNSFDLCRLMIETRKDQIVNRPWVIRVKAQPGETKKDAANRQLKNPNVTKVTALLKFPDGVHSFDLWIRMWIEQLLVFDAPCIYPIKSLGGDVLSLRLVSGATITPLLDHSGFIPEPPSPAYQQIILGIPTANLAATGTEKKYSVDQLIYSPRNPRVDSRWGFGPVEQIITTLSIGANRQQFLRDYYVSGNVPEGLLPMPESWTAQQIKDFQKWFDSMLAGNLKMKRRMIMIPDAKREPTMTKHEALTDVTDDYLIRVVAFAFSITPQNLIKQVNRGTAKESSDVAQIEGLEPYLKHIENVINGQVIGRQMKMDDVEFAFLDEREMDPVKQATVDSLYLKSCAYSVNEIREARGDDPRPEPQANELGAMTATGWMSISQAPAGPNEDEDEDEPPIDGHAKPVKIRKIATLKARAGDLTPRSRQARNEFAARLKKFLADQKVRVSSAAAQKFTAMKAAVPRGTLLKDADTEDRDRRLAELIALLGWDYQTLYGITAPYLEIAAQEGVQAGAYQAAANLGASLPTILADALPKAKQAADDRAAQMVGFDLEEDGSLTEATAPAWAISTTAKDDVLAAIKQAIAEEWTPQQLEAVIQASVVWTPEHGDLIADNEIARQQTFGHLNAWLVSGKVLEYQWTVMDLGCCPLCASFAALGPVKAGYQFAPMIYAPGAHPACRCWLTVTKIAGEE